jgi:retron-type reverse transcriptase
LHIKESTPQYFRLQQDFRLQTSARLLSDITLSQRTNLSPENVHDLLNLCLTTTYFQWREKFYEQTNSTPMRSPLSPVMANLFMGEFEKKALATATLKPGFWFRYVDDTLLS